MKLQTISETGKRSREDAARLAPQLEPCLLADREELVRRDVVHRRVRSAREVGRAREHEAVRVDRDIRPTVSSVC